MNTSGWLLFATLITGMMALDLWSGRRSSRAMQLREALLWSLGWVAVAMGFAGFIAWRLGNNSAFEFLTGYLVEKSLSVDNIFVFLLCFQAFRVPTHLQHRVLFWGVIGALAMRLVLILAGISLLERFHWLHYLFGLFLCYSGWKLLKGNAGPAEPGELSIIRWTRRLFPVTDDHRGEKFWVREQGVLKLTPLLLVLICVEATDLVFAFDSIPAILAITQDPFLVFTSNALALLGMRALYFAVQGLLSKLRYLHQGLAAILVFVGAKLMLTDYWHVSSGVSLVAILSILATAVGASLLAPEREAALEVDWAPQETPEPEL